LVGVDLLPARSDSLALAGFAHLLVTVADCHRAAAFYARLFGLGDAASDALPGCGHHAVLRLAGGEALVLCEQGERPDLRETGVHQAYRVSRARRDAIAARLGEEGIAVFSYKEDRPAEASDNVYFFDPDGNRIQLVAGEAAAEGVRIDHACVLVADILWAERFYGAELGLAVDHRTGWRTEDYARARRWAAGEEEMAPGTRRLDKRYTVMVAKKTVPRANMQLFYRAGDGVIGLYLANKHFQEPPEEQLVGAPRLAFRTSRPALDQAAARLETHRRDCLGPMEHPASSPLEASLYFKDTGGNFLELCAPRKA
jgi:catechol-2,3-dioxygenase